MTRNRRERRQRNEYLPRFLDKLWLSMGIVIIVLIIMIFGIVLQSKWDGKTKVSLVFPEDNGNVGIVVFDPGHKEMLLLTIPGNTEVSVAHNMGVWKLQSVWQLAEQNNLSGGELLAGTITKNFTTPVYFWSDVNGKNLGDSSIVSGLKAAFIMRKTNLPLADRIRLAFFANQLDNASRITYSLDETGFLQKTTLIDGATGYKLTVEKPPHVLAYFTEIETEGENLKVIIEDAGGGSQIETVSGILETMGMKVAAVIRKESDNLGCKVSGKAKKLTEKVSTLFSCEQVFESTEDADIRITLGTKFIETY